MESLREFCLADHSILVSFGGYIHNNYFLHPSQSDHSAHTAPVAGHNP